MNWFQIFTAVQKYGMLVIYFKWLHSLHLLFYFIFLSFVGFVFHELVISVQSIVVSWRVLGD